MAIFTGPRWPDGVVPYILEGDAAAKTNLLNWVERLNGRLGRKVFIPYLAPLYTPSGYVAPGAAAPAPAAVKYASIEIAAKSESGEVGYHAVGAVHQVKVEDESRLIHELLHVLGFQHEQNHRKFGWTTAPAHGSHEDPAHMVRRPCAGDADWNTLLWNTYGHMPPAPDRIETQLVYWGWTAHPADQADSPVCDIWSAMMYKSCREAVLAMKRHIEHPQTHATWTQKMQNLHVFGFNGAAPQDAIAPVLGPNDRYNLSSQDKIAVLRRYGGHEMVNHRIAQHWKQATARGGLHYRSRDLTHLDEALESCDIRRIRPAFDKWYSNNGSEASHRNRGNVVTQLRDALSGQWGFVSPVY